MILKPKYYSILENVVSACMYNHSDEVIIEGLLEIVKSSGIDYYIAGQESNYYLEAVFNDVNVTRPKSWDDDGYDDLWSILVNLFGDYGTSPRYGWLTLTPSGVKCIATFIKKYKEVK